MNMLMARYLDDRESLTAEECGELAEHLERHPAQLNELRGLLAMDDLLSRRFDAQRAVFVARVRQAVTSCDSPSPPGDQRAKSFVPEVLRRAGLADARLAGRYWRPLAAAAAGLMLGLFGATVAGGYAAPRTHLPEVVPVPGVKGSFEGAVVPMQEGFPTSPGLWGAGHCRVTRSDQGITPVHGGQMLRIEGTPGKNARGRAVLHGDCYQIVDLRPARSHFADGCANLKFSAWFNAVADTGDQDYTARLEIHAFHGDPAAIHPEGDVHEWLAREHIATAERQIRFDHDPAAWQAAATSIELPVEADYVVMSIHIAPARPLQSTVPEAFPGHYVDFVRLALLPHARPSKPLPLPFDSGS